jgi:CspA family cold shock protein
MFMSVTIGTKQGSVKWFDDQKGYGFIIPDVGEKNVFVHFSAIVDQESGRKILSEDDRVAFDIIKTDRGFSATNVSVVR